MEGAEVMIDTSKLYSISQLAEQAKISTQAIRKAIKDKRLKANKIGKQWVISYMDWTLWRME